jgi:hypothetical protein
MKKIILVIAAIALIASPAMAVDWNFYGSARMATFYDSRDFGDGGGDLSGKGNVITEGNQRNDEDDQIDWELQGNSRLGATVKAENIGGRFEFGITDTGGDNKVTSRRIFGTWDFGAARLKVGKDYTPVTVFDSGQVFDTDAGLLNQGNLYGGRNGQISLAFGGFEVALIDTNSAGLLRNMATGDVDEFLPKIEAKWGMAFDTWNFQVHGGYQYFEIENAGAANEDVDVDSWVVGGSAGLNLGPFYVKTNLSTGQNMGNAGWGGNTASYDGDDQAKDIDTVQGMLAAGFKFTDQLTFEAGVGYRKDESDFADEDEDETTAAYLQAVISLAPGVWIIPEVGMYDYNDDLDGDDEGDEFYLGAKWQIDF